MDAAMAPIAMTVPLPKLTPVLEHYIFVIASLLHHYYVLSLLPIITTSLLRIITSLLCHYYVIITSFLCHR